MQPLARDLISILSMHPSRTSQRLSPFASRLKHLHAVLKPDCGPHLSPFRALSMIQNLSASISQAPASAQLPSDAPTYFAYFPYFSSVRTAKSKIENRKSKILTSLGSLLHDPKPRSPTPSPAPTPAPIPSVLVRAGPCSSLSVRVPPIENRKSKIENYLSHPFRIPSFQSARA